jgi:hypothetical protein
MKKVIRRITFVFYINIPHLQKILATSFHAGILLGLFDPEDGSDKFLRNNGRFSTDYMMLYPRR